MKELKIEVPQGYEIDKEKSTFEKIVFKKVEDLPMRFDEMKIRIGYISNSSSSNFIIPGTDIIGVATKMTNIVIDIKNILEKIREQVQNIE